MTASYDVTGRSASFFGPARKLGCGYDIAQRATGGGSYRECVVVFDFDAIGVSLDTNWVTVNDDRAILS